MSRKRAHIGSAVAGRVRIAACAVALGATTWWAFAPLDSPYLSVPTFENQPEQAAFTVAALDLEAFRTPLWVAPPAPPEPE